MFFLITILPVIQLIPTSKTITADRYTYIPLIGLFYIIAEGINWVSTYNRKPKTLNLKPNDADAYYRRGNVYYSIGENNKSADDFNQALKINPYYSEIYYKKGNELSLKGDYDNAIYNYNKVLEFNPKHPEAYYNRGIAYFKKGEYEKALEDVKRSMDLGFKVDSQFLEYLLKHSKNK